MTHECAIHMMKQLKSMEKNLQVLKETNNRHNSRLQADIFDIEQGIVDMEKVIEDESDILQHPIDLEEL